MHLKNYEKIFVEIDDTKTDFERDYRRFYKHPLTEAGMDATVRMAIVNLAYSNEHYYEIYASDSKDGYHHSFEFDFIRDENNGKIWATYLGYI